MKMWIKKKLIKVIDDLNKDTKYHGILVQLPLPRHINSQKVINAISPQKDVDGFILKMLDGYQWKA